MNELFFQNGKKFVPTIGDITDLDLRKIFLILQFIYVIYYMIILHLVLLYQDKNVFARAILISYSYLQICISLIPIIFFDEIKHIDVTNWMKIFYCILMINCILCTIIYDKIIETTYTIQLAFDMFWMINPILFLGSTHFIAFLIFCY